jgi:hypothetical protein
VRGADLPIMTGLIIDPSSAKVRSERDAIAQLTVEEAALRTLRLSGAAGVQAARRVQAKAPSSGKPAQNKHAAQQRQEKRCVA